jgi:hypothetical protein
MTISKHKSNKTLDQRYSTNEVATKIRVDLQLEKQMKTRDEDKTNNAIKKRVWVIKINPTLHIINNKEKIMPSNNNVEKMMVAKGDNFDHIELEIANTLKQMYDEAVKSGYKGTMESFQKTLSLDDLKRIGIKTGGTVGAKS